MMKIPNLLTQIRGNNDLLTQAGHGSPVAPRQQGIQLKIRKTARRGRLCRLRYFKRRQNRVNLYQVQRYSFRRNPATGQTYFYGYDIHSDSIKSFLLQNIRSADFSPIYYGTPRWRVQMGNDPDVYAKMTRTDRQKQADLIRKDIQQAGQQQQRDIDQAMKQAELQGQQAAQRAQRVTEPARRQVEQKIQPEIRQTSRRVSNIIQPKKPLPPIQTPPGL